MGKPLKFLFNGGGYHQLVDSLRKKGHYVSQGAAPWMKFFRTRKSCDMYNKIVLRDVIKYEKPDVYICSKGYRNGFSIYPDNLVLFG